MQFTICSSIESIKYSSYISADTFTMVHVEKYNLLKYHRRSCIFMIPAVNENAFINVNVNLSKLRIHI